MIVTDAGAEMALVIDEEDSTRALVVHKDTVSARVVALLQMVLAPL